MPFRYCSHILTDGRQCGAPALRKDHFCYWHTEFRRQQRELDDEARRAPEFIAPGFDSQTGEFKSMYPVRPQDIHATRGVIRKPLSLDLGIPDDPNAIQVAIARVLTALAAGRIETRRASILLYGLQLAANNCRSITPPPTTATAAPEPVLEAEVKARPTTDFNLPAGVELKPETYFENGPNILRPGISDGPYSLEIPWD